jgi:hypothetical protein
MGGAGEWRSLRAMLRAGPDVDPRSILEIEPVGGKGGPGHLAQGGIESFGVPPYRQSVAAFRLAVDNAVTVCESIVS